MPDDQPQYLTEAEAAAVLRRKESTLRSWRRGERNVAGPPWIHVGKVFLYDRDQLAAWIRSQEGRR